MSPNDTRTLSVIPCPRIRTSLYWIGITLYGASFFLPAFVDFNGPVSGWTAAGLPEVIALVLITGLLHGAPSLIHFSVFVSVFVVAWINPVFLIYAIVSPFSLREPSHQNEQNSCPTHDSFLLDHFPQSPQLSA
jgi:hypothetical protein